MALSLPNNSPRDGECEYCGKTDVKVTIVRGDAMCVDCLALESSVPVIEASRQQDATIEVKSDIFTAQTVAFAELRAAILADNSIPDGQKEFAYVKECHDRMQHFQKVAFDARRAVLDAEKSAKELQTEILKNIGKLRTEEREAFMVRDFNYNPTPIKSPKPKAIKSPKAKSFGSGDMTALYAAAKKYNVPANVVRGMVVSRPGMTAEAAALELAKLMGLA